MDDHRKRMTRRRALGLLGAAALAGASYPLYRLLRSGSGAAGPVELTRATAARLQALLDELMSRSDVHQAIVAVEAGSGSAPWVGVAGSVTPGGAPLRADTPYFVASVTKLYTATAALRLHERGQLGLDDSISGHLPRELIRGLHRLDGSDRTDAITVRHLLSHTSGLADYFEDRPKGGRSLSDRLAAEGDFAWSLSEILERVRTELVPHFPPQDPAAKRQKVRYSDTNYQLLGAILEAVTGKPLHLVFEEEIFQPLGLEQSYLFPHRRSGATAEPAPIWMQDGPRELPLALGSLGADGGIVSTAGETLAFLRALIRGHLYSEPATLSLMQARWNRFGLPLDAVALRLPSWPIDYGLGLMRFQLPALLNGLQPMPALFGHTGSTGSWLFHCPELDVMLAGTLNHAAAGALPYRFLPRVLRALTSDAV